MEYKTGESAPLGGALSRETPRIGLVLLAAGQSRRMGTNKQLLPWRERRFLMLYVMHYKLDGNELILHGI